MIETIHPISGPPITQVEPGDRLVVLARTIETQEPDAETALKESAKDWARFGETCLGQALYRHRSIFHNGADAPVWSHLELSYFREMVPADVIHDLVMKPQPTGMTLLRAEILFDHPRIVHTAVRMAGLGRPVRVAGIAGIYRCGIEIPR